MKRICLIILVVLACAVLISACEQEVGYGPNEIPLTVMDDQHYIDAVDFSDVMGWTYRETEAGFSLTDSGMTMAFSPDSVFVVRKGQIMQTLDVLPAVSESGYLLTLAWLTDSFGEAVLTDAEDRVVLDPDQISLYEIALFFPAELRAAFQDPEAEHSSRIMAEMELPRSMEIDIAKIDVTRIMNIRPVTEFPAVFKQELQKKGYSEEEIAHINFTEYSIIERTWPLPEELQQLEMGYYPDIPPDEIAEWTYGDLQAVQQLETEQTRLTLFREEDLAKLRSHGVTDADLFYLLKEFRYGDRVMEQTPEIWKRTLETVYQSHLDYWLDDYWKDYEEETAAATLSRQLFCLS